jgi:hypothetical protein
MPDPEGFQERLERAIDEKKRFIEEQQMPSLQKAFRTLQTLFENLYNVLIRKSLIQEDPYKYEHKLSEITVPSREPFLESERRDKLSQRLSEFHSQLEFLNTTYQFSLEFLTLERLKRMVGLVQYINWQNVVETSPDPTTAVLADALARVRLGTDRMSIGVLTNSISQLQELARELGGLLRDIVDYQREAYKLRLRKDLLSRTASALPRLYSAAPDKTLQRLRGLFAQAVKGVPFYRELVREILEEEYGSDPESLRQKALARLAIPEVKPQAAAPPPNYRAVLKDGVRHMLAAGRPLAEAREKLDNNQGVLDSRRQRLADRLRAWWRRTRNKIPEGRIVQVEFFDSATGRQVGDRFNLTSFLEGLGKKAQLFTTLASSTHPSSRRLESAGESALYEFLSRNLRELQLIHRRLEGLDEYYKSEASPRERPRIRGMRIEASALKNCIVGANKRRYEYVARMKNWSR